MIIDIEVLYETIRIQSNYPKDDFKVYIVDNISSNESRDYLEKTFPEAIIIPRPNGNYSAANNDGILRAIKDGFEYFVVANMDTKFDENWLKELVMAVQENDQAGMVQSKVLLYPKERRRDPSHHLRQDLYI